MEVMDESLGSHSGEYTNCNGEPMQSTAAVVVAKGKRTKRHRSHQRLVHQDSAVIADSSSASSAELEEIITEEDEDMANCLILLAQGHASDPGPKSEAPSDQEAGDGGDCGRTFAEVATTITCVLYECKTCNKSFPSFQALGGHRASHKKPKLAAATAIATVEDKKEMVHEDILQVGMNPFSKPIIAGSEQSNTKAKIHECSICGSEFNSGQALGGHMRRHRPVVTAIPDSQESKKERSLLSLDLNLPPAPADDETQRPPSPAFAFAGGRPLIFAASASPLVDCHY